MKSGCSRDSSGDPIEIPLASEGDWCYQTECDFSFSDPGSQKTESLPRRPLGPR